MHSKIDPYALPDLIEQSLNQGLLVNPSSVEQSPNHSNNISFAQLNSQAPPPTSSFSPITPIFERRDSRRVSFSNDKNNDPTNNNNNFNSALTIPAFLDNPLPSGTLPDYLLDSSQIGENNSTTFDQDNDGSVSPTNLESLPEYNPSSIPLPSLDVNDPTALPDLPRFPAFNFSDRNNDSKPATGSSVPPRFPNGMPQDLNSVSELMISGEVLEDTSNLPQIPTSNSDAMLAPDNDSFGSSGLLPQITPINPTSDSDTNNDGVPLKKCGLCDRPIEFDGIIANGLYLHKICAKCAHCEIQLTPPKCVFFRDQLLCLNCAVKKDEISKCAICQLPLDGFQKEMTVPQTNQTIHTNCLCCFECSRNLAKGQQEVVDGKILCRRCSSIVKQRICAHCEKVVIGEFVFCHRKYYHPDHFVCAVCQRKLMGNNYMIHHNRLLCPDHAMYFQQHCSFCKRAIYLTDELLLKWGGKLYHKVCFVCRVCGCELAPEKTKAFHCRPHCETCFKKRMTENSSGFDTKRRKHVPVIANERRKRFTDDGVEVLAPVYAGKNDQFLEIVEIDEIDVEEFENEPRLSASFRILKVK